MIQARASAKQSRYAIQIFGSGIPNMIEHLLVNPCELSATGEPSEWQVPYLKKIKKNENEYRRTSGSESLERDIRIYLIRRSVSSHINLF
jgi:hypothetical protein